MEDGSPTFNAFAGLAGHPQDSSRFRPSHGSYALETERTTHHRGASFTDGLEREALVSGGLRARDVAANGTDEHDVIDELGAAQNRARISS